MARTVLKAVAIWLALAIPAMAITPYDLVTNVRQNQGKVSFQGLRTQKLTRQADSYHAAMRVHYRDAKNLRVIIEDPGKLTNVNLWLKENRASVYFPDENLLFRNDNPSGANEVTATILGEITTNPDLLYRNYMLTVMTPEALQKESLPSAIAGRDCHVLDIIPKGGFYVPGHRYWIAKDNHQIMREDRTWAIGIEPYFQSQYTEFTPTGTLDLEQRVPRDINQIELKTGSRENAFVFYKTIAEAEKAIGGKLATPGNVPPAFVLHGVEVSTFYATQMVLISYTDGLNWLYVRYRPADNLWVTLLAGAFAAKLADKFMELAIQSPYNYYGVAKGEKKEFAVFTYGDLYPEQLQKVGDSMQLQTASR
ncbi:MAG: hypothetical protein FJZ01_00410 [Candidatus Sericytochromatia bacterium]|nr:hypothetical protein [Candidatus Tanganyikabacteria bacterium]